MPNLPKSTPELMQMTWADYQPIYAELLARPVDASSIDQWLADWSRAAECLDEMSNRLAVATAVNTADEEADRQYKAYLDQIYPPMMQAEQKLKEKLLETGLEPNGFEIPLRNIRSEAALFSEQNVPLLAEEHKLGLEYDKIKGGETVVWDGQEKTVIELDPMLVSPDRTIRERAWTLSMERMLENRAAINALWKKFLAIRLDIARNAKKLSYRDYKWQQYYRFDYSPADCQTFHSAIEKVVVPAVKRILENHRKAMGVDALRPWDIDIWHYVDPHNRPSLKPFTTEQQQLSLTQTIFDQVDPVLGGYFKTMVDEGLIDLMNRKNKGPGAFCAGYNRIRKPFVFCNSTGTHDNVQTLLHESGHAFHVFESANLPYLQQLNVTMEFAEVASMGMELLAAPYLEKSRGGFYSSKDAARAVSEHLITALLFWPYMAVVDAFQHWVYEHPNLAVEPTECDTEWSRLWDRFMPVIDWTGLEEYKRTGWHRKLHIHQAPFYYIEYGLAQLGAVLVWRNSLQDHAKAVRDYRHALALGGTRSLPELYQAAGAHLAFDAETLKEAVDLMESEITRLEKIAE